MVNDWEQRMNNSYKTQMFNEYGVPLEIKTGKAIHNNYERAFDWLHIDFYSGDINFSQEKNNELRDKGIAAVTKLFTDNGWTPEKNFITGETCLCKGLSWVKIQESKHSLCGGFEIEGIFRNPLNTKIFNFFKGHTPTFIQESKKRTRQPFEEFQVKGIKCENNWGLAGSEEDALEQLHKPYSKDKFMQHYECMRTDASEEDRIEASVIGYTWSLMPHWSTGKNVYEASPWFLNKCKEFFANMLNEELKSETPNL